MKIQDVFYSSLDEKAISEIPSEWWLERFRNWRTIELQKTDWTQLPDATVDKTLWATYRQALRDLPAVKDFANAELPTRPE